MDVVLGLDAAARDGRVKGVIMRLGNGALSTAEAQEIDVALHRFRAKGKFVIADATAFFSAGLGDYLAASAADEIWVQPKSPFSVSGTGGGEIFLRGTLDKLNAEPQIAKRAEYKSAADMFMEKQMSPADREQLTAVDELGLWQRGGPDGGEPASEPRPGGCGAGGQPPVRRGCPHRQAGGPYRL